MAFWAPGVTLEQLAAIESKVAALDVKYGGRTPWPNFGLTNPDPLPTGIVIPASGTVDAPVFRLKDQDRSGVTILPTPLGTEGGTTFRVAGEIWDNNKLNNIVFGVSFAFELSGTGNGDLIVELDTLDDVGAVLETSHYSRPVTTNQRQAAFSLPEKEAQIPGLQLYGSAFYDLVMRLSTTFGNERTASLDYIEIYVLKVGESDP